MFSKKTKYKVQVVIQLESIEQLPTNYIGSGSIKISWVRGKNISHKGETKPIACETQNITLPPFSEIIHWNTKLLRDEKTLNFEPKVVIFKLKHTSSDGHKTKTLGTAEIDLAQLCLQSFNSTTIALQFAAHKRKLKAKATMKFDTKWIKIGDQIVRQSPEDLNQASQTFQIVSSPISSIPIPASPSQSHASSQPSGSYDEQQHQQQQQQQMIQQQQQLFGAVDETSELSESSWGDDALETPDGSDDSHIKFESADLEDEGYPVSYVSATEQSESSTPVYVRRHHHDDSKLDLKGGDDSKTRSLTSDEDGLEHSDPGTQNSSSLRRSLVRQNSHPESVEKSKMDSLTSVSPDVNQNRSNSLVSKIFSASVSALPSFDMNQLDIPIPETTDSQNETTQNNPKKTNLVGSASSTQIHVQKQGRPRNQTMNSEHLPKYPAPFHSTNSQPVMTNVNNHSKTIGQPASQSLSNLPSNSLGLSSSKSSNQLNTTAPAVAAFISFRDASSDPTLPASSQGSIAYLSPSGFAMHASAVAGDEIGRLRSEVNDKNIKVTLLARQVEETERKLEETEKDRKSLQQRLTELENSHQSEISQLEKKYKRLRKKLRNATDETLDDSSTTSSDRIANQDSPTAERRKKKKAHSTSSLLTSSGKSLFKGPIKQIWTPEEERIGLLIVLAVFMLITIIAYSTQFWNLFSAPTNVTTNNQTGATQLVTQKTAAAMQASTELAKSLQAALNLTLPEN